MELTDSLKRLFIETAQALKGSTRRRFMARTVQELGRGGQRRAERDLGWNRQTIRKALRELESGLTCVDGVALRRRKRTEEQVPTLLDDITAIVDSQRQVAPPFRTNRRYTRLTAAAVRRQRIRQTGYRDAELPTERTIATKLNDLGYYPTKVAKTPPQQRSSQPLPSSSE